MPKVAGQGHTDIPLNETGPVLALHLLQVSLVYVNTLIIQQILGQPDCQNRLEIEDLQALSPLIYAHIYPYGQLELTVETRLQIN